MEDDLMKLKESDAVKGRFDAFRVDPRALKITDGYNVRDFSTPYARERLDELKESIREEGGVLVPLEVRMVGDDLHIVSGHRRHRAVMELIGEGVEIESIPAIAEQRAVNDADRVLRLITHNSGEPLSMLEKAEVVRRLINMGWERPKIAARLGYKTPASIANFELLLQAPEAVKQAVRNEQIAPSTAVELVRAHGDNAGAALADAEQKAEKRGKKRASIRDTKPPAGNADPFKTEQRNQARITEAQHNIADLEDAIMALVEYAKKGRSAKSIAAESKLNHAEVERAVDYLYELCDALRIISESQKDAA